MIVKHIPEDFAVEEITNVKKSKGRYCYFWLEKRNMTTQDAVDRISQIIHKRIGFAGNKDKKAVTKQLCSAEVRRETIEHMKVKNINLIFYGFGDVPISLGDLKGNKFRIVVRDIDIKVKKISSIINYFDEQRFSQNNCEVGQAIVRKNFRKAVELIASGKGDYNKKVQDFSLKNKTNAVGALRLVPLKILRMMVHAYQSKLWNDTVEQLIERTGKFRRISYSQGQLAFPETKVKNREIPIIGFDTVVKDKDVRAIMDEIVRRENMLFRDFIIREIPELTSEGVSRDMVVSVKKFKAITSEDDIFNGKDKVTLSFELPKGSYATMVVKTLFLTE
ncbi:tRNA pseudouridine(13) synthase TruD [Candidatus Woesearchaeota archaeon]|nr:tRNA pseudouridine(13) synthase TruD [Candidatus Woesearchaeota archaeon]